MFALAIVLHITINVSYRHEDINWKFQKHDFCRSLIQVVLMMPMSGKRLKMMEERKFEKLKMVTFCGPNKL